MCFMLFVIHMYVFVGITCGVKELISVFISLVLWLKGVHSSTTGKPHL